MLRNLLSGAALASVIVISAGTASAENRGTAPLLKGHSASQQLLWARTSGQRPSTALVEAAAEEQTAKGKPGQPATAENTQSDNRQARRKQTRQKAAAQSGKAAPLPAARPSAKAAANAQPEQKPENLAKAPAAEAAPDKALKEGRATTTTALPGVTTTPSAKSTTTAAVTTATEPKSADAAPRGHLQAMVARHAAAAGIPFSLAHGVVMVESRYRPNATGPGGYIGLMQLSYRTAQGMGFKGTRKQLYDPETNIRYGVKYLAGAYRQAGGNKCLTVSKYQGGHGVRGVTKAGSVYCSKVRRFIAQMPKDQKVQLASSEE